MVKNNLIKKFEYYSNNNLDDILDKISKYGYENLSYKDKEYLKNFDKKYIKYENDLYNVYIQDIEYTKNFIIFYIELIDNKGKYEGNVIIGYDGIIRIINLYNLENGEEFESEDYYKFDKLFQDILNDYLTKKENLKYIKKFEFYDYIDENKLRNAESRDKLMKMAKEMGLNKKDLINIAYNNINYVNSKIPVNLIDDLEKYGGDFWFVMDYKEDATFGKLIHLADKILGNDIDWWRKLNK